MKSYTITKHNTSHNIFKPNSNVIHSQKRIIIYAESYLEAKEALFEFNPWADKTYNILEYKKYEVDKLKYGEILNLDIEMLSYPRIL